MKNVSRVILAAALGITYAFSARAEKGDEVVVIPVPGVSASVSVSVSASAQPSAVPSVSASAVPSAAPTTTVVDPELLQTTDVVDDQPVVTTTQVPPVYPEVPTVSPAYGYVWTPGYWHWGGSRYYWSSGYWRRPPALGYSWSASRWTCGGGSCAYSPGRWVSPTGVVLNNPRYYTGIYTNRFYGRPAYPSGYRHVSHPRQVVPAARMGTVTPQIRRPVSPPAYRSSPRPSSYSRRR